MWMGLFLAIQLARAESGTNASDRAHSSNPNKAARLSDKSIYQIETVFTNDIMRPVLLSALKGRCQIVTMFFSHCNFACPLLVHQMKEIEARLPESMIPNIGFMLVSFDTARDTPEALAAFRKQHDLPAARWMLLRAGYEDVLELSALLGVKFKKDAAGDFTHSNVITLLNAQGEIVFQQTSLKPEPDEFVKRIAALSDK
jgi:protein SCO1/2